MNDNKENQAGAGMYYCTEIPLGSCLISRSRYFSVQQLLKLGSSPASKHFIDPQ